MSLSRFATGMLAAVAAVGGSAAASGNHSQHTVETAARQNAATSYHQADVSGLRIFYREAGDPSSPTVLLLHGFPTSSHMYRNLIPMLSDRYHIIAPDLPGFGFSDAPDRSQYNYTFDHIAETIDAFTQVIGLRRYAMLVFDYGAPVGWRLAVAHPDRITAIISQNGNAYEEGLSKGWSPIQKYWQDPSEANRAALREFLAPQSVKWQYVHGAPAERRISLLPRLPSGAAGRLGEE